ncbi:MAG TPA: putative Ig domain-containing protein [Burkholderiaceae bacterium]|nr:putative Ig domain-containing protein [Burkholderiaceae bacterium]
MKPITATSPPNPILRRVLRAAGQTGLRALIALFAVFVTLPAQATQTINGITIDENLPQARRGVAYSYTIPVPSGGTAPYAFSLIGPSVLPIRLTMAANGQLTGIISCNVANGSYRQDVRVTDSSAVPIVADFTGNKGLAINVTAGPAGTCVTLTLTPATLPAPMVGAPYNQTITASGGLAPYTFAVTAGTLPAGLTLNTATGQLSGTPTTAGAYSYTIRATDAADSTGSVVYSGTVSPGIVVNPATLPGGTVGTAYSRTVSATGGNGTYSYSISAGALPAGLTLNAATGVISGTPTTPGAGSFTIRATDTNGAIGSRAYAVTTAAAPIVVNPASLPAATVGAAYSQTVIASGGVGGFTYSISAGTLPAGLTLNASSGVVSGTPTTAATSNFTIRATDTASASGTRAYSITTSAAIVVNPANLPGGTVGTAYSSTISATGGTGAKTFAVSAGALPAGLTLNASTGVISGTPTAAATYAFTIRATDTIGATGTRAYSVTINPAIVVNPASLPGGTLGTPYSQSISPTGGTGTYTFSVSAGALPAGLTLNAATGAITGTPTTAATSNFTIRATDGNGAIGSRAYTVAIAAAIVVNPASLPGGTVGSAYSSTVTATGGTGTRTFSVSVGTLPAGLALNASTGVISGTPTTTGTSSFTIRATDSIGAVGSRAYTVTINPAITVSPASLPNGTSGTAYSRTISASGGTGTYSYSVSAGSLGAGLALNAATGVISGTPTTTGARSFTIRATDGNGTFGSQSYTISINAAVTVNPATLPNGTVGTGYSQTVTATGGTGAGTYTYSVSVGALPAGLALNASTGVISGTPTSTGSSSFTIRATDGIGAIGSRAYTVTIAAAPVVVNPATLPGGAVSSPYSQSVSATGGTGSYTFSVSAGSLGAGLALNASTGAITGTPTTAGTRTFTIRATDTASASGTRSYTITISATIAVNPATLPGGTAGTAYSQTITATGGSGAYTFSVSAGALPAGLALNASTGVLSGTPAAPGSSSFTIRATDGNGASASRAYSVTMAAAPIVVNPATLAGGTVGTAYSQTVSATGGTGSLSYSISAGALPAGLSLNGSTGAITGTPTAFGTNSFTVRATDGSGSTGTRAYSVTIAPAPIVVNPASLPGGAVGSAYSQTVTAIGGSGTFSFSVSSGALPAGLTLNAASGVISGTPTAYGPASLSITATDGSGATGTRAYSVTIAPAPIVVNPVSLPGGTVGSAYSQAVSATGGTGSFSFSVSAGTLPAGLTLNAASGVIAGTPTTYGPASFSITATDGSGATGTRAYSLTVAPAPIVVSPLTLPGGTAGAAYLQNATATGGTGGYTFGISAGALPAGLNLNASSGVISGTPTTSGSSSFTLSAMDSSGSSGTRAYTVTVNAAMSVNPANLPGGTVGTSYSQTINATGGTGSYTYAVTSGTLPAGLSLSGGVLSGTPSVAASNTFTITATDGNGVTASRSYTVTINAAIAVNPASLAVATVGAAYSQSVTATGGTGTYVYSVSAGALPAGLALNAGTGSITGTPTATASSSFTITATDGNGATGSRNYTLTPNAGVAVNPPTLPPAAVGAPYSQMVTATGGSGSFSYSVTAGALPAGLTLNAATGAITGMPTTPSTSAVTISATDSNGVSTARAYSVTVNAAMALNPATLPNGSVAVAYVQTATATGGNGSYTYSVSAGALPAGLALNAATGAITGTPTTAGTSSFTISAVDGTGVTASRAYSLAISPALALNPPTLPNPMVGAPYSQTLNASGGSGTYSYSVTNGSLPAGLTLNASTGMITGTPTTAGPGTFTVTVTDGAGSSASRAYNVDVAPSALVLESTTLGNGIVGTPYNQAIVVSGGTSPYGFTIASGQLPAGVSLNASTGALVGTPTTPGTYAFTVRVVDAGGATAVFVQSIVVEPRPDPSADPTVRGILASQISAASRFGTAQVDNVGARVRMLHFGQDPCSLQFDVSANIPWERAPGSADDTRQAAAQASNPDDKPGERKRCDSRFAFWAAGNVDFGFLRPNTATTRSDFTTSGLTLGADTRVMPGLVLGASLGYGRDATDVGTNGSESRAQGVSGTFYGSYEPIKSLYVDFLLGYGGLNFDSTRWNDAAMLTGGRNGSQTFGSIGVSTVIDVGALKFAPYGRYDRVRNRLDAYTESGPATMALSYADVTATDNALAAGLFASYRIPLGRASLEPALRFEVRRVRVSSADQSLWYADLPLTTYSIADGTVSDTQLIGGAGLVLRLADTLSVGLDYSYGGSNGVYRNESLRLLLRAPF